MANPVNAGDPAEYLAVLAAILPAGTAVAPGSVVIQKGLQAATAAWPALILNAPRVKDRRSAIGIGGATRQASFEVHGMYLDRWESGTRALEQILGDANAALQRMKHNVLVNPSLGYDSVIAGDDVEIAVDGPVHDPGLGFTLVTGEIVISIKGPAYTP